MKGTTTGWRIVVDADSVGLTYKDALRAELEKDLGSIRRSTSGSTPARVLLH